MQHPDYNAIKAMITGTLDRLNKDATVASVSDAVIALRKARERKTAEAFAAIFSDMTLEKLAVADGVLAEMFPRPTLALKPLEALTPPDSFSFKASPSASPTSPPASNHAPAAKPRKGKR